MQKNNSVLATVILLAPFVFSFAFAMDVYIPVVPAMKDFFHTSQANIQLTLSLFMFVFGLGQLIMGPITDQYGRRKIIYLSSFLFTFGSLLCALANSIEILIIGRVIQAFGGCGMMVTSMAIVRDRFEGNESAKVYSFLNCGIAMSPLFAPIIGSYLAAWFDWRAEFIFLTLMGLAVLVWGLIRIKETLPKNNRVKIDKYIFQRYWEILTHRTFIVYAIAMSAGLSVFFTFFSSSPYIVINLLHAPVKNFGYYFFTVGFTFFIGSMVSGKVSERLGAFNTVFLGTILMLLAGVAMLMWYQIYGLSSAGFILPSMLAGMAGAFMIGAGAGGAMQPFATIAGTAAALFGCLEFLISSFVGSYVMRWQITSTMPLAITIIALSTIVILNLTFYRFAAFKPEKAIE